MNLLAFDVGGANLKAADGRGFAVSEPFPLWQRPAELPAALREIIARAPSAEKIAVTMTGELADCFETKAEGVAHIVEAVCQAAGQRPVLVYLTDGSLVPPELACRQPLLAAAANWHALASFAGRYCASGGALLVDVGSTTTDIVPLVDGRVAAQGKNDPERLAAGELVYTGVVRSPVCAVVDALPWRKQQVPVAAELFATTRDAYLLLGDLAEDPTDCQTADGRPATKSAARDRLARMICADRDLFSQEDALAAAVAVARGQLSQLGLAARNVLRRLPEVPGTIVISGQGEFIARQLCQRLQVPAPIVSLAQELGATVSQAAAAHALAVIAGERT
ncbi:MAG TPA: hydantoinase/oxoprolinase family protein [Pirellulales bacterium]|nr:hydantoinase/oxoprolinase family protein [Pirellulales bacterium]